MYKALVQAHVGAATQQKKLKNRTGNANYLSTFVEHLILGKQDKKRGSGSWASAEFCLAGCSNAALHVGEGRGGRTWSGYVICWKLCREQRKRHRPAMCVLRGERRAHPRICTRAPVCNTKLRGSPKKSFALSPKNLCWSVD